MRRHPILILLVVALLALGTAGCLRRQNPDSAAKPSPQPVPSPVASRPAVKTPDPTIDRTGWPVIVAFGDSLTAGLGVPAEQNYPSQLQAELDARGYKYRVVNAGISGDLSLGGLNRVDKVLEHNPQIVILELGANDGLQGKPVEAMKRNLGQIVQRLKQANVTVVLAGMHAPPNYGPEYTQKFHQAFVDLAAEHQLPFIPFLLDGVGGLPDLNLADGIHPTAQGYTIVVKNVMKVLEPLLKK
jgi:acyl-CoA thioesterase-1